MRSSMRVVAMTVELRRNTSKLSFETLRSGDNLGTSPNPIPVLSQCTSFVLADSMGQPRTA